MRSQRPHVIPALGLSIALLALSVWANTASQQAIAAQPGAPMLTATPTSCPIPTPPVFQVEPPISPTQQPTQTLRVTGGPWREVVVDAPAGVFTGTPVLTTSFYPTWFITVTLRPGNNTLTVTAISQALPPCSDTPVTMRTTVQIERQLFCPSLPVPTLLIEPLISRTTAFTQVVHAGAFDANAVTVTLFGPTQTALYAGALVNGEWQAAIDLRHAGARVGATGRFSVEVSAHLPPRGDPECGLGERVESTRIDRFGNPLIVDLEAGVCPAVASQPPRVWPVISPWPGLAQQVGGERGPLTQRVIVLNGAARFTATLPTSTTWQAAVGLQAAVTNTLIVQGVDFADTQCETVIETARDVDDRLLAIRQEPGHNAHLPLLTR